MILIDQVFISNNLLTLYPINLITIILNLKSNNRHVDMVHYVLTNTAV